MNDDVLSFMDELGLLKRSKSSGGQSMLEQTNCGKSSCGIHGHLNREMYQITDAEL